MSTKIVKRKFEWIIENITREKLQDPNFKVWSDIIHIDLFDNRTEWKTLIITDGSEFLKVYLEKKKVDRNGFMVKFKSEAHCLVKKCDETFINWGWPKFYKLSDLFDPSHKFVDEKSRLKLNFEIELFYPDKKPKLKSSLEFFKKHYDDTELSDFTLTSSERKGFPVHRVFLADRSEFFKKMFTIDMKEKKAASVIFEDVNSATLQEVIKFIYTGKVEIPDDKMTKDLLYAAEKFGLAGLKSYCIDMLVEGVKTDNVLELLKTADMFNANKLEEKCLKFIMDNYNLIEPQISDDWITRNISLMKKITKGLANALTVPHFTIKSSL